MHAARWEGRWYEAASSAWTGAQEGVWMPYEIPLGQRLAHRM